jgi:VanZ family protein
LAKLIKLWLPVVLWAGLIFFLSGIPYLKTDLELDFLLRKIAHITEYFVLTLLLYRAFRGSFKMGACSLFLCPATLALLYAASDELHQRFVQGRCCSVKDVLIDSVGIIIFYVFIKVAKSQGLKVTTVSGSQDIR